MKLLFEDWEKYIYGDWQNTYWEGEGGAVVTIGQILDEVVHYAALGDGPISVNVEEIAHLSIVKDKTDQETLDRINAGSLAYPIILIKSQGEYKFVLDGNHRLQKAVNIEQDTLLARILDLDNPETPAEWVELFGGG